MVAKRIAFAGVGVLLWAAAAGADAFPDRYWPAFPKPERILRVEAPEGLSYAERLLLQTAAGRIAYDTRTRGRGDLVWMEKTGGPSYDEWLARAVRYQGVEPEPSVLGVWELVDHARTSGLVKGYILYAADPAERPLYGGVPENTSANVAVALCSVLPGVAVEESIEAKAKERGLELLLDVRDKDERWLWERYGERFSKALHARQDPRNPVMMSAVVAMNAMLTSQIGPLYEECLAALEPGSPVLGWGIGDEYRQTYPSTLQACFQTATNWCQNLEVLSSGGTGLEYPVRPFPERAPARLDEDESDARYVSFVLSDGDNVQWLMGNFFLGREAEQYYASPDRGRIAFGWTTCAMDLLQLCPYALDHMSEHATENDDFVLLAGGYYYPDAFGRARPEPDLLAAQARRTGRYMDKCGIGILAVNAVDWDGEEARAAYATYAREIPGLRGILAIQYAPYTAGRGAVQWVRAGDGRRVPVLSPRHAIWSGRGDDPVEGTPAEVAAWLNAWARRPVQAPEDRYAWVIVHAWSWFRRAPADAAGEEEDVPQQSYLGQPGYARGYGPAVWCAERLAPSIRVVTPTELFLRLAREVER